ncbi:MULTISPECIES: MupA/Atu3671 family FMN-dependent luciferase-like monooxygenase [unclassified Micromonospora]|jgi:natural product biosynthesis luciferase-like monooxygenase protein|uniref:MupA/Atu3671 family FMN-dependent luciferase-like monooxygenase n=1 Tax=Micromonospora TaxID=1873 RepID=UPI002416EE88|nr:MULTISPECIES: MupA/Atu3671 family FMN-dependent luciferase-like monooxygenase [unclassified Micromonospora]MDG4816160.1 LLM class flavin-dependent oxidoreductase [Micromonospora sp. WMMD956]WFE58695.1 LLM class flavin-dependent oxidoreductase [Micromonospora sp. WMMD712]
MDFSLFYFANDSRLGQHDRYRVLLEGARFADANDFAAVWTPERHFHPFGGLYPNPSVTSAAVAAVTSRVAIRAGSVVAPLHHPLRIAEEWAMVDNLSNGRVGVSLASGWHAADFVLRPETYADRRALLAEYAEQVRALWRGESITATDGVGETRQVRVFPPPVQAELPIWLTSGGAVETFRTAGELGAGLLTHLLGQDLDELAAKIAVYREAAAARPGGWPGHVALMVHTHLGDDEDETRDLVRPALSDYIRSSLHLILGSRMDGKRSIDPSRLPPEELDFLVERSFQRYFDEGGLLGTVDKAYGVAGRLREIGVDEVACLIDFGLPDKTVLAGLDQLNELRLRFASADG